MAFHGALAILNTTQPVPNGYYGGGYTYLTYDTTAFYDTDGIYDTVSRQKLIVPAALNGRWVKIKTSVRWTQLGGHIVQIFPSYHQASANLDWLSSHPSSAPDNRTFVGGTTTDHCSETHPMQVFTGDYFKTAAWQSGKLGTDGPLDLQAGSFSMEVLD